MATATGIELIGLIKEELLKSCELTGIWEKKLRDIEHKTYDAAKFISELKEQINSIVRDVLNDNENRRVTILSEEELKKKKTKKRIQKATATKKTDDTKPNLNGVVEGVKCPVCGKGVIVKGKTAYGCSRWKEGCTFRHPFA